ncbi:two component transcriptional regulator, LuxR family [Psychrobacillus sp. OK028]|uniref:response regulator n=1 Tax=Psychrobacillus sp. OK028 TaxID=1884359 RepID=UPI00088C37B8|nr:response regulator transcription factor [Psychrobacillus sp. OK028]SDM38094.1 two component transcriptional regulator, LuxR family [Psychrobacillus sp. OK028]
MRLVIIDNHPLIRRGLVSLFSYSGIMEVLGEATNRKEAINLLQTVKPDIAIVDLRLGDESGIELIKEAIDLGIASKFVILTSSTTEEDFRKAKEIGVAGYLLKEALPEELLHAVQMIGKGRKYYDPTVLDLMMKEKNLPDKPSHVEQLTPKEMEILIELGKGHSNKEISKTLYITEFTVKKHVSQVFAKLGLADRTQAALYANAKGLVKYVINS